MSSPYHDGSRSLQDRFDTEATLASIRVLDELTIAFPNYDGNGMYLSTGNLLVNRFVGMLFIDFVSARPSRLRLNGTASIDGNDELLGQYPGAQFIVRVRASYRTATPLGRCSRSESSSPPLRAPS